MSGFLQTPPRLPDAWSSDRTLREALEFHLGDAFEVARPFFEEMGRVSTDPATLALGARAEREPPVHVPYSAFGERIDEIRVSDAYVELGRIGVEAGVTALPYEDSPFGDKARLVWAGVISQWSPSSALYSCPIAMTDAAARTLIDHGGEAERPLVERLTTRDPERAWTSGQWMTETTGGSDISRTETIAKQDGDMWRLFGTKWFTSATTSEMALTLARPEGSSEGSRALVMFRVQRLLDDGTRNAIVVRRLKDKLGTRTVPTAELELQGAIAHPIGDPAEGGGVRKIATMLNITRIHNAIGSVGSLARGLAWARAYAQVREAFGVPLHTLPAHRATLTELAVDHAAALALLLRCCELTGKAEHASADGHELVLLRGLTPVLKLATARWAVAGAAEAMEAIGGVGYCEDSTLPALVRNTHVQTIWEGTTNVLSLDLIRAAEREGAVDAVFNEVEQIAERATHPAVAETGSAVKRALGELRDRWARLRQGSDEHSSARSFALGVATTFACAQLCEQGAWAAERGDGRTANVAQRLAVRGLVPPPGPADLDLAMG
ncbi:MAG TPA: acyl-CoA dehydrogenase family protein [Actinomycetota bacterium]|nr:acyl-CoA dehydrogenase family protein [Actinomycetota bacterium]